MNGKNRRLHQIRRRDLLKRATTVPLASMGIMSLSKSVASTDQPPGPGFTHAGSSDDLGHSEGDDIVMRFDFPRCIHKRNCVTRQPHVYRNDTSQWMNPEFESAERIAATMESCPSGALQYHRKDGGDQEKPSRVNTVHIWENGPLALRGDLVVDGINIGYRATLCRCGRSNNEPFCDGSHKNGAFQATGEPDPSYRTENLTAQDGPLKVTKDSSGPIHIQGNLQICAGTGRKIAETENTILCGCGKSSNKPFCDDSHKLG